MTIPKSDKKFISNGKSIIFHLDNNLKIYQADLVNSQITEIYEIKKTDGQLQLFLHFDKSWKEIYLSFIKESESIYLVLGADAGFTDSRVIFIWLKSNFMFNNQKFKILKSTDYLDSQMILNLVVHSSDINLFDMESLTYSAEPRIGIKL